MGKHTKLGKKQRSRENAKDKRRERLLGWLFGTILVISFAYRAIFQPTVINDGNRILYFNGIPMTLGAIFLIYLCLGWLRELALSRDKPHQKLIGYIILVPCGIVFLYLMVAMPFDIVFYEVNRYVANQNKPEIRQCQVTYFHKKKGSRDSNFIEFQFDGKIEYFRTDRETVLSFAEENPNEYLLEIEVRTGILGTFQVESWDVVKK
ncbi:hypothetical protein [Flavobacterium sp.]|uniref:hypothetical protein n=1 Tax=Flavobacterium sp. TaxID=239 RepID=UPI001209FF6A|nr:hypothetical protein [Flavobacterium sp.]RZJ70917.1 MAG: hypothetical protein EOO49_12330 [Flavobacterium sp.]